MSIVAVIEKDKCSRKQRDRFREMESKSNRMQNQLHCPGVAGLVVGGSLSGWAGELWVGS